VAEALAGTPVLVGGQDCRPEVCGALTGDVSAEMLHDAGAQLVILGHSERRTGHRETDAVVAAKVEGALRAGLEPIVCVGETLEEREDGQALAVVERQLAASLPDGLAGGRSRWPMSPVWAIGTGARRRWTRSRGARGDPRRAQARFGEHGAGVAHPVRRLGEGGERARDPGVPDVDGRWWAGPR
jgi:triosephosphate isomerase